ncbi:MAG TPA: integration host factor subunit beta [Myxococcales bacterium]|nr:integration host factor subunit beta [Myxococcales bacterium]
MTKSQLIEKIADRAPHVPRRAVEAIVNAVWDTMVDALRNGQRIEIRGFGSFAVKRRRAREARNPKTGRKVSVPERRSLSFTVGKELRDRLNPLGLAPVKEREDTAVPAPAAAPAQAAAPASAPAGESISGPAMAAAPPTRW